MAFEINITPDDIDLLVKESLIKSAFGKSISEGISKTLNGYNSPVTKELEKFVAVVASEIIREKYDNQIREAVIKSIEDRVTSEMINKTVDEAVKRGI